MADKERSEEQQGTAGQGTPAVPVEVQQEPTQPKSADVSGEPRARVEGHEQPVFDRVTELERQLQEAQGKFDQLSQEVQAKQDRRREQGRAALRRWRERNPERAREQNAKHSRTYRRKKAQGS